MIGAGHPNCKHLQLSTSVLWELSCPLTRQVLSFLFACNALLQLHLDKAAGVLYCTAKPSLLAFHPVTFAEHWQLYPVWLQLLCSCCQSVFKHGVI